MWPGLTNFPDFTNPNASSYWSNLISTFYNEDSFDGLWIDMNEISNFCVGSCLKKNMTQYSPENDPYDNPPFNPLSQPLNISTISMNSLTFLGVNYNTHNLFGFYESIGLNFLLFLFYFILFYFILNYFILFIYLIYFNLFIFYLFLFLFSLSFSSILLFILISIYYHKFIVIIKIFYNIHLIKYYFHHYYLLNY